MRKNRIYLEYILESINLLESYVSGGKDVFFLTPHDTGCRHQEAPGNNRINPTIDTGFKRPIPGNSLAYDGGLQKYHCS